MTVSPLTCYASLMGRKRKDDADEWAGSILAEVERQANKAAGLDIERTEKALDNGVLALMRQAESLAVMKYDEHEVKTDCPACKRRIKVMVPGADARDLSRALAHTSKMLDDITRLREFAQGKADSRPDKGSDWLKLLTPDQLTIVTGWIEGK